MKKPSKLSNYRPISILSNLDKILEQFIRSILTCTTNNLDFAKTFLHPMPLLVSLKINQKCVDDKQIACGVFIDLKKAFDILHYTLFLDKLINFVT